MTLASILRISYGIQLQGKDHEYVAISQEALDSANETLIPGKFLVDAFPICKIAMTPLYPDFDVTAFSEVCSFVDAGCQFQGQSESIENIRPQIVTYSIRRGPRTEGRNQFYHSRATDLIYHGETRRRADKNASLPPYCKIRMARALQKRWKRWPAMYQQWLS